MYLGRRQNGQELAIVFLTKTTAGVPVAPDAAPLMSVYDGSGATIENGVKVPSRDYPRFSGRFDARIQLDERYSTGQYTAVVTWLASGVSKAAIFRFEVIPGGDGSGQITSMINHPRPNANFIVNARSSGRIYKGRNPLIS